MKKALLLFTMFVLTISIYPQKWQKIDSVFSPIGIAVKSFSSPFLADFNNDGKPDLLLGGSGNKAEFYFNASAPSAPHFSADTNIFASIYKDGYQFTNSSYPIAADLNGDGLIDLFIGGFNGILYYKNIGTQSRPAFEKVDTVFAALNSEIGVDAKPAFADLDGDGDLDLIVGIGESLFGGPEAGQTFGYRNTGTKYAPVFVKDSTLVQGFQNMGYNSYPAPGDIDGDGDIDLLFGRDKANLLYYQNTGSKTNPVWSLNSTPFAPVEQTSYWKNPTLCDIDGDGDLDLIYGTSSGQMYYYQNTGSATAPKFTLNSDYFAVIKAAGASTVSFADFDKNGTMDFISGTQLGQFLYFKNNGTSKHPVFAITSSPFSTFKPSIYSTPVFIDLNKDGYTDIVAGSLLGKLNYYVNNNGVFTENTAVLSAVNVLGFSSPTFGDINNDGNPDLLVGAEYGTDVKFYLNYGNNTFVENSQVFSNVTFHNRCKPVLADVDGDGDVDLIIGESSGEITYYENTGNKSAPVWTLNESVFAGIEVGQDAAPGFADLDGDGRKDLIVGEYNGNLTYYKNLFATVSVKENKSEVVSNFSLDQNYPNPFNPSTVIKYSVPFNSLVSLKLFDLLGNEIKTLVNETKSKGSYEVTLTASNLASGTYFYQLKAGNFISTKKLMLVK